MGKGGGAKRPPPGPSTMVSNVNKQRLSLSLSTSRGQHPRVPVNKPQADSVQSHRGDKGIGQWATADTQGGSSPSSQGGFPGLCASSTSPNLLSSPFTHSPRLSYPYEILIPQINYVFIHVLRSRGGTQTIVISKTFCPFTGTFLILS